ncbi:MAG: 16S rRNA (guanine(527)-N(7))-methyltransferase RsmG [Lachnospiraceae bacterium]|nr:16S rRNA (guanine(527)-N(7))-methyltransferase RsmG [Lachnospiraceae bacterium]
MNNIKKLTEPLSKLNIELTDDQISLFLKYHDMLIKTNKVMNLTAITDFNESCIKHYADSLSLIKEANLSDIQNIRILDIGTGAGFPGIPLKIAYPYIHITLLDSLSKRIRFLNEVIGKLKLNDTGSIYTVDMRAEDYVKEPGIRESYDLVVSRAVAGLNILAEYALPYVKIGGSFISYKGDNAVEEISAAENAVKILGGEIADVNTFTLPDSNITRTLINIKKTCPTPDKYPRKAGLPNKKPL